MITYSTNFMGPVSNNWYTRMGIPYTEVTEPNRFADGGQLTRKVFAKRYAGGRIDVHGTDDYFGQEIGVPIMEAESWNELQQFLWTFSSDKVLTLEQIVQALEDETGFRIVWFKEPACT
ncbi:hypothetical protein KPN4_86 [Klebsiella phage KPN4]|uniref:Uncharacterized protein n=1 Tax=Klebsiella phage KPN4 TaxID=2601622 RepID=A0A5B9NFV9_9CAUD|nr:hypothetical protein KPN4_86 [Klebsiella phage KPN4]